MGDEVSLAYFNLKWGQKIEDSAQSTMKLHRSLSPHAAFTFFPEFHSSKWDS
jgi:hypothetical protein